MANKPLQLKLDTGFTAIPIMDSDGEQVGEIKFNPSDIDIVKRYEFVAEQLEKLGTDTTDDFDSIYDTSEKIKELMDYLFNCNVSEGLFKICNPLTPVSDGDFFVEKVLEGIAGLIEQTTNQRLEKKKVKIQKATTKYQKGGMKAAVSASKE